MSLSWTLYLGASYEVKDWSALVVLSLLLLIGAVRISWLPGAFWRGLQWTCLSWTCVFFSEESGELFNSSKQDFLVLIVGQSGRNLLFANKFHTGLHLTLMSFFSHYSKITFTIFFFHISSGKKWICHTFGLAWFRIVRGQVRTHCNGDCYLATHLNLDFPIIRNFKVG